MTEQEQLQVTALQEKIALSNNDLNTPLPFELFDKQSNKTTKLLATSGDVQTVDGRNRWYEYKLKSSQLISNVTVNVDGYGEYSDFVFQWWNENGDKLESKARPSAGIIKIVVNDLCKKIAFQPPSQWFSKGQILQVQIEGVSRDQIGSLLDKVSDLEAHKQDIMSLIDRAVARSETKIAEAQRASADKIVVQREIQASKAQQTRLKKNIDDLSLKRNELLSQNTASEEALASLTQRAEGIRSNLKVNQDALTGTKKEISDKEKTLKELRTNINLFPTEIVEFVNQGSRNVRQYFWLALAPISIIAVMFVLLIIGAADLSTVITSESDVNIAALVISRTPYVVVALGIITACYKISRSFIMEMMKINSQRLNLTKISIIAKDVSAAAEAELGLSDEEVYRLRTELKMQLLRDHMKDYLSKDFRIELPRQLGLTLPFMDKKEATLIVKEE